MNRVALAALLVTMLLPAPSPAPQYPLTPRARPIRTYVGAATCAGSSCHGSTRPLGQTSVLQNEYYTWLNADRHAQAYNRLFGGESAMIARNLRLGSEPYQARICLDCHALKPGSGRADLEDGVSCEACHGPAGGWLAEHTQREWSHEDSVRAGMIDLRDVPTRARLCLGCHLGDATRTVDHEMIAAGHPRLTFELDNYTEGMAPHWKSAGRSGIRAWAIGQAVSLQQSAEQLRRSARSEAWPEFAFMECTGCHHDLKDGAWRRRRGYRMRAGLPHWSPARFAVFRHLLAEVAPAEKRALETVIPRLADSVARMRDAEAVAGHAGEAARAAGGAVTLLSGAGLDQAAARRIIQAIARDRAALSADLQVAEQTALALQSLTAFLAASDPRMARSPLARTVDQLFAALESAHEFEPNRFEALLLRLDETPRPPAN